MVTVSGDLRKMATELHSVVQYWLRVGEERVLLNDLMGATLRLEYHGEIHCVQCGRKTSKSFQQGHCFVCMRRLNDCNNCVLFPERCTVEEGTCPHDDWAHAQCHAGQTVYLANTSGLKVGITRDGQIPTRWIDQGAMQAIPLFHTSNRYQAGLIEVAFKAYVADKTNWRTMLKQDSRTLSMPVEKRKLLAESKASWQPIVDQYAEKIQLLGDDDCVIRFPVNAYPSKIKSQSFDKTPVIEGMLQGIKGQYLMLDTGVLNIRKFSGYGVSFEVLESF